MKKTSAGIAYEDRGEGFPILCLHGYYPDHRLMTGCLEPLFGADHRAQVPPSALAGRAACGPTLSPWRRIYPDLPLMGQSVDPPGLRDSDAMLTWILGFIEEVLPPGQFLLAGESYGGYLSRGIARALPGRVAGLLFICPLIVARTDEREVPTHGPGLVEEGYGKGTSPGDLEEFESVAVVRDSYCLGRSLREIAPGLKLARAERLETLRARGYSFSFDQLGRTGQPGREEAFDPVFQGPSLFLLGREDSSTGWRDALRLADRYPKASYAILDGAGHNLQIEAAGLFSYLVGDWLGRCELDLAGPRGAVQ